MIVIQFGMIVYEHRKDPFGKDYYWFAGDYKIIDKDIDADDVAINNNYVSITPIHYKLTNTLFIEDLKNVFWKIIEM